MFISLIIGYALCAVFILLFVSADGEMANRLRSTLVSNELDTVKSAKIELNLLAAKINEEKRASRDEKSDPVLIRRGKRLKAKMDAAAKRADTLNKSGVGILDLSPLAGYRVSAILGLDNNNDFVAKIYNKCMQFKEKQEVADYTAYIVSSLIGNLLLGAAMLSIGVGTGLAMGLGTKSLVVGVVLFAIFALLGYVPYDSVNSEIKKRAESIEHDFPRVVSKLALLTVSGIETMRAWNLVASSDTAVLYNEMQRVNIDLAHNVNHAEAFTRFIKRCANPYTTKLATAILQNYTMGNAEIVKVLRELNDESWAEYKHSARRKGELISTKLMIPTLLLFAGILILVIVPVVGGFNI